MFQISLKLLNNNSGSSFSIFNRKPSVTLRCYEVNLLIFAKYNGILNETMNSDPSKYYFTFSKCIMQRLYSESNINFFIHFPKIFLENTHLKSPD